MFQKIFCDDIRYDCYDYVEFWLRHSHDDYHDVEICRFENIIDVISYRNRV